MQSLSFKFKLLLAMMLVVCGITGATLYLGQRKLEVLQGELFQQEYESEVALFTQGQEARLGAAKEKCRELVRSVRLIAAMHALEEEKSEDSAADGEHSAEVARTVENLYKNARDEFNLRGAMQRKASFFRFLSRDGKVLPNPEIPEAHNNFIANRLKVAGPSLNHPEQEIGYLPVPEQSGAPTLHEIILTKMIDPEDDAILGALAVGFAFEYHEHGRGQNDLANGIVVEGDLYAMDLSGSDRSSLVRLASQEPRGRAHLVANLHGTPHRIYLRNLNPGSHLPPAVHVAVHSMGAALEEREELEQTVLAMGASAMGIALLMSLVLSHGLTGPVNELVQGTKAIREGDYSVQVPVRNRDEIGALAESFNEMAVGLALKEKYRSVLDIVADKGIAQELMTGKIELGGEERNISVLFCDIRGFTALTEKMQPPEVIQMLNEHFTPLTRVVYEHHGVVDKFVGDLIMAIFGAPKSGGNDARNAVNCALSMIRERTELNLRSQYKIRIGIGIATGRAVAGRMGSSDRMNYTVLGPKVNLASRLCGQAAPMDVVVDCETLEQAADSYETEPMPEMKLKGFAEAIKAWKVKPKIAA